jgi:hypothetical protein
MRALAGHVVDGRVVVPGEHLQEGASVTILVEDDTASRLTDDDIAELKASQGAIRGGDFVTADDLFDRLGRRRR